MQLEASPPARVGMVQRLDDVKVQRWELVHITRRGHFNVDDLDGDPSARHNLPIPAFFAVAHPPGTRTLPEA